MKKIKTKDIAQISLCTALTVICAYISIPLTIPITLQTLGIFLISALLGKKKAVISVLIYVLLGFAGLPVFSGVKGGISTISGPTGGYIIAFLFASLIVGFASDKWGIKSFMLPLFMVIALIVCYLFGSVWYTFIYAKQIGEGFAYIVSLCVVPYIVPDLIKIFLATLLARLIYPKIIANK